MIICDLVNVVCYGLTIRDSQNARNRERPPSLRKASFIFCDSCVIIRPVGLLTLPMTRSFGSDSQNEQIRPPSLRTTPIAYLSTQRMMRPYVSCSVAGGASDMKYELTTEKDQHELRVVVSLATAIAGHRIEGRLFRITGHR